ncbi:FAD-dependent oxidoreductase [Cellulomonas cellasea]|uniref:Sarcosine oxidase n=1 Tax=Cellulomonas cellasea TaxID=43670 RepID=A0A7W4YAC5_9CELL|nr:FAD-dependent oxidoreductase [Cellulomonas cellasea]MBB2922493.1 sarcosine oxidase [Cellulomonas cellasea]
MGERAYEVAVVGGGAAGSATAWALARRGVPVVLLERQAADVALPETGDEQIVRLAHPDVAYVRLAQSAHAWWATLGSESGEELLTPVASVEHGPVRAVRPVTEALLACGAPFEYLTGPEAGERWPGMRFDDRVIVQPSAARVDARRTVALLQRQAVAHGATVRHGAEVLAVTATEDGGARVRVAGGVSESGYTPEHELVVGAVVVAAGAATAALVDGVPGLEHLPEIRVARTEPARFAARDASLRGEEWVSFTHHVDPEAHAEARGSLGVDEGYPALAVDGRHVPGVGAVVGHRVPAQDAETDAPATSAGPDVLRAYVEAWLPGLDPERVDPVTRTATTTPDGGFLVDRVGPVVLGAGFGGDGAALAPALGQLLADLAVGPADPLDAPDLAAFTLARFATVDA